MNRNVILIAVALVVVIVVAVVFGRGLLPGGGADAPSNAVEEVGDSSAASGDQSYAAQILPVLAEFEAWQSGPIAQRTEALETKMENVGALSNLTYGNFLLLYLQAQATGRNDLAMDWVVQETISPKLQPIYESIVSGSTALMAALNEITPPAEVADHQNRLLPCLDYENKRSQAIVEVLSGTSSIEIPSRSNNPCADLGPSIEALRSAANQ